MAVSTASVEHEPWPLYRAALVGLKETVRRAATLPEGGAPALVHYSPGVHVRIGAPCAVRRGAATETSPERTAMATTRHEGDRGVSDPVTGKPG